MDLYGWAFHIGERTVGTGVKHRRGLTFQQPGFYTAVVFRCAFEREEAEVRW